MFCEFWPFGTYDPDIRPPVKYAFSRLRNLIGKWQFAVDEDRQTPKAEKSS